QRPSFDYRWVFNLLSLPQTRVFAFIVKPFAFSCAASSVEPADETRAILLYGRTSGLILTGSAGSGHQQALDALFDITLQRIVER
ncbi:hypothetical protein ABLO03_10005, partial [Mycobacterium tuberculosis]